MTARHDSECEMQLQLNNAGSWKTVAWFPPKQKRINRAKHMAIYLNDLGARGHFRILGCENQIVSEYRRENGGWRDREVAA